MVYANINQMIQILTEKGFVEDGKIQFYALLADYYINSSLTGIANETVPLTTVPDVVIRLATALGCAYFFKFESGDTITAEEAERQWDIYFNSKYRRPRFIATAGTP